MKHSEFIRRIEDLGFVEDLGFEVIDWDEYLVITSENGAVGSVNKNYEAVMQTNTSVALSKEIRTKLFDILVEYARTPIEDRKDEKKYSIYPIWTLDYKLIRYDSIFHYCGYEDEDSFGLDDSEFYNKNKTRVFNEHEAKEICDFFGWEFNKVAEEVDDEI